MPYRTYIIIMINIIKAEERHYSDSGWLKTYWLFSFADYNDPDNVEFGKLRVFNDDTVEAGTGFPDHPHNEMEIVTIVLSGELTHRDSTGHGSVIKQGDVQRMSAGSGIIHSEMNLSGRQVRFYQIWLYPSVSGLEPGYEQKTFDPALYKNRLFPVASGLDVKGAVTMHVDATIYLSDINKGKTLEFKTDPSRGVFIYITSGSADINKGTFSAGDQARITLEETIRIKAREQTALVLIDVPPLDE